MKPVEKADAKPAADVAEKKPADQPVSADEKAILLTAETFVKDYGKGDAKSIAAHFTTDAEYIDELGDVHQGREAIEGAMTAIFADNPGGQIEIDIETIRFISPGVAVEDGTTAFTVDRRYRTGLQPLHSDSCEDQRKVADGQRAGAGSEGSAAASNAVAAARMAAGRLGR